MAYNLTDKQKDLAIWLVDQNQNHGLPEEFTVYWIKGNGQILDHQIVPPNIIKGTLDALANDNLIVCVPNLKTDIRTYSGGRSTTSERETSRSCTLLARLFEAVDSDFDEPDTSFVTHLSPLADVTNLDDYLKKRCLPILGAGSADPLMWDSAVRAAGVILEQRLREVGGIEDQNKRGIQLVNAIFGKEGVFSNYFEEDAKRQGYRDLYAGIMGTFRNRSAHWLVDPEPEDGGAFIVFVNLLLKMLEDIRE